jgi:hypothetical protein
MRRRFRRLAFLCANGARAKVTGGKRKGLLKWQGRAQNKTWLIKKAARALTAWRKREISSKSDKTSLKSIKLFVNILNS